MPPFHPLVAWVNTTCASIVSDITILRQDRNMYIIITVGI